MKSHDFSAFIMDINEFGPAATGKLYPVTGIPHIKHAFVPDPLPAAWKWPAKMWPLLLEARTALASLDGTGKHLPNPEIILRPLQNREAQKSSSLEGTYTDPQQQLLFGLEPYFPRSAEDPANAYREVFNYSRALRLGRTTTTGLPLSLRLVRQLHRILMRGVRGSDRNPGEFRKMQNQVGRPARYVPPPATHLSQSLDLFEKYLHTDKPCDPLVEAFICHYQFEAIHPFMDGNGRVGRLLLALTISDWCELSNQWLYMSDYFDRNKDAYIDKMFAVSTNGKWSDWIEFCLVGVVEQARDTMRRCERLIDLNRQFHEQVNEIGGSIRLAKIVDGLFVRPVLAVAKTAKSHRVSYPTARSDLRKLERIEIIKEMEGAREISYFCPRILNVTYAD